MKTAGEVRYETMFTRLRERHEAAFVPFAVLGDPDRKRSLEVVRTLAASGADALELGIPFSDPVADGPAIQAADRRALESGTRPRDCWAIVARIRDEFPELPIGLLVYANLVFHGGTDRFYGEAADAGVDSVLVADAPLIEFDALERSAVDSGVAPVLIASPNVSERGLEEIAHRSRGYVYVTARPGVTGVTGESPGSEAAGVLRRLAVLEGVAPPMLGFGIGTPEHVRGAVSLGAAGAISGSAIATRIERSLGSSRATEPVPGDLKNELSAFCTEMKLATARGQTGSRRSLPRTPGRRR